MANPDPTTADAPAGTGGPPLTSTTGSGVVGPTAGAPPFVPLEPDELPSAIGPYRVLALIGRGGMGAVYRAEDPALRREVAVKVMLPRAAAHAVARARFVREARAQAKVEHDHVAPIFQVGEHAGLPFIAMPLLKGMTLAAALQANPRPPVYAVVRIGRQIAEGLAAAHEKGLIHRDVKPGNVWLEGTRLRVKILDFGIARPVGEGGPGAEETPLSAEGAVLGTPGYMSPEQARSGPVAARADLFSLGVVLYEMVAGRAPFDGADPLAVLAAVIESDPTPVADLAPAVPAALAHLIDRLLAKDPADRPPSAAAVAEELRQIELALVAGLRVVALDSIPGVPVGPDPFASLDATGVGVVAGTTHQRPASPPRWLWPAALLALVATGAVGWVAWKALGPRPKDVAAPAPDRDPGPTPPPVAPMPREVVPNVPNASPFFNGKNFVGWSQGRDGQWAVKDGAIVGFRAETDGAVSITTNQKFQDFVLSFQFSRESLERGSLVLTFRTPRGLRLMLNARSVVLAGGVGGYGTAPLLQNKFNDVTLACVGQWVSLAINGDGVFEGWIDTLPEEGAFNFSYAHELTGKVVIRDIRFTDLGKQDP